MSTNEALDYVDLIVETLHTWGIISEQKYGTMNEEQRQRLAELVAAKSEE